MKVIAIVTVLGLLLIAALSILPEHADGLAAALVCLGFAALGWWRPRRWWAGGGAVFSILFLIFWLGGFPTWGGVMSLVLRPWTAIYLAGMATWPALVCGAVGAGARLLWDKIAARMSR